MKREDIEAWMHAALVDVLGLDEDEVTADARFFHDLDGESIDLLDLSFKCQQHFGVNLKLQDIFRGDFLETDAAGRLTDSAAERLRAAYPFLDVTVIRADPTADGIKKLLTVDALVAIVDQACANAAET